MWYLCGVIRECGMYAYGMCIYSIYTWHDISYACTCGVHIECVCVSVWCSNVGIRCGKVLCVYVGYVGDYAHCIMYIDLYSLRSSS